MASQRILKSKISWGGMPPNPPRGERALLVPSPSPVTLHYSPATTFLNENPACSYTPRCSCFILHGNGDKLQLGRLLGSSADSTYMFLYLLAVMLQVEIEFRFSGF